jgi:hypothetical protein
MQKSRLKSDSAEVQFGPALCDSAESPKPGFLIGWLVS